MRKIILLSLLFIVSIHLIYPCTTAVITGRATKDGRPLLYKQRDTGFLDNKVMLFEDGLYKYIGIVNSVDTLGKEVWGGHNSVGFAIMNSASYNLNPETKEEKPELEGVVMKLALQKCKTLKDFENLLDTLPKPMYLSANFGVIDAEGGAAYYETGDYGYKKYDANETADGYLVRTNYSYSGDRSRDLGVSRDMEASLLFKELYDKGLLSYRNIHKKVSRSLRHGITGIDLYDQMPKDANGANFVPFRDFIPRYSTSSSIVVEGVKEGESPSLTTMWTILGSPLTMVTIPLLITEDNSLPQIVLADDTQKAPLCSWGLELKKKLFPMNKSEGKDYLDLSKLINASQSGILQKAGKLEDQVLWMSDNYLREWRKVGSVQTDGGHSCKGLYEFIDTTLKKGYEELLEE